MASKTFIQIPSNVDNPVTLRRFLGELILRLDIAFGNRAQSPFASTGNLEDVHTTLGTVHATLGDTATTLDVLQTQLGAINGEVDDLQTQLGTVNVEVTAIQTQIGDVNTTLNTVNGEVGNLQTQLGTVNIEVTAMQTQLGGVNTTLNTITATLSTVSGEVTTLQTQLATYSAGFNQPAQASLNFPAAPTIASTYDKTQVQQLANDVKALATKVDSLLVVLRNAKIISV
jgi:septal ring factor EnvC (AmiA/AmiB activator)